MPVVLEVAPSMTDAIQGIFTGAATEMGGMLVPIFTAGAVIIVGILAFNLGKRVFKSATR
ncbi:hypothetical protein FYJ53_10325 [Eubacterium sp. BL-380-WT-2B]|uniref:hypothetical protein n=1 Tax=Eubacterium sp. BL-380-WT-2B TaxID=2605785 RepID=UPI0012B43B73|nr:hypothetical protein [Eubacterium sp. BL-380-WT-2B]MSS94160.1 hypothetical protein [Eubacterium sp. BL-380-WT-2B]